jgi:hypothetical protein
MTDPRLGYRDGGNVVTTVPTQYATGEAFVALQDATPTTLWFDSNNFSYLRPGTTQVSSVLYSELAALAGTGGAGGADFGLYAGLLAAVDVAPVSDVSVNRFDDFIGDTIDSTYATAIGTNGTVAASSGSGVHAALLTTSATNPDWATMALGLQWPVLATMTLFEAKVKLNVITEVQLEIGLSDALSETAGLAFSSHDVTPVAVATNAVMFGFHNAASPAESTAYWSKLSVKADVATQSFTTTPLVANTYVKLSIAVNAGGSVGFYINDVSVGSVEAAVATSAVLTPWISVKTSNTTSKILTVDYWRIAGSRS